MENVRKRLSCADAKELDMVDYLATIGFEPTKQNKSNHWYCSPFRDENTPSFKIDSKLNRWFDYGEGKGGNLVDFGVLYYRCTVTEFLDKLNGNLSLPTPVKRAKSQVDDTDNHIIITNVKPLSNYALLQYIENRGIFLEIARKHCEEVSYMNGGKSFYAIGFKNDLGGYELRSKYFKGSSSPKGITHEKNGHPNLTVFEGFFNFLSFQTHFKNNPILQSDFLILNSLSFFDKARPIMDGYKETYLYLDNNTAGQKFTTQACAQNPVYQNKSCLFAGFEDLNDFLRQQPKETSSIPKRRKGLTP
jgi:hypothetical protein